MNDHFHDVLSAFQSLLPSQNVHFLLIFQLVHSDGCRVERNPPVSASKRLSSFVSLCDDLTEMVGSDCRDGPEGFLQPDVGRKCRREQV